MHGPRRRILRPRCLPRTSEPLGMPTAVGSMISYVSRYFSMPSWWVLDHAASRRPACAPRPQPFRHESTTPAATRPNAETQQPRGRGDGVAEGDGERQRHRRAAPLQQECRDEDAGRRGGGHERQRVGLEQRPCDGVEFPDGRSRQPNIGCPGRQASSRRPPSRRRSAGRRATRGGRDSRFCSCGAANALFAVVLFLGGGGGDLLAGGGRVWAPGGS